MHARDTSKDAHAVQVGIYRAMPASRRSEIAMQMSDDMREVARAGIRARHPDYTEDMVRRALVRLLFGAEVASRMWPEGAPVP